LAGWSWGCVTGLDCYGRTIFIADAHRDGNRGRFIVRANEKLTAFVELELQLGGQKGWLSRKRRVFAPLNRMYG